MPTHKRRERVAALQTWASMKRTGIHPHLLTSPRRTARRETLATHVVQHGRAGRTRVPSTAGSTAGRRGVMVPASGTGHLTRSRPQDSASNAAAAQWEPRKPLGGHMTKGQRAMAVAKIYPEPETGGRGQKSVKITEFEFDSS